MCKKYAFVLKILKLKFGYANRNHLYKYVEMNKNVLPKLTSASQNVVKWY